MTDRLYYSDAYEIRFEARVSGVAAVDGRPAVLLDRTAFYPASGGQPSDRGHIGSVSVLDVVEREDDGEILHVVETPIAQGSMVRGEIAWDRRFDHMQQHTGQHVLSAALHRVHGLGTESVHLGTALSTVDVSASVTDDQVAQAEREANRVIWENRPVHIRFVEDGDAVALALRKSPARQGTLRVIEIESFDLSACGGTHVARTGEIGAIVVAGFERYKGGTRIEFACGARALAWAQEVRGVIRGAARQLSTSGRGMSEAIERIQTELRAERHSARVWQDRAIAHEARQRAASARAAGDPVVLEHLPDWDVASLRNLGSALAAEPELVAVLIGADPGTIVVASGSAAHVDASAVVRALVAIFGGRGGGRPVLAQAGGLSGTPEDILAAARERIRALRS